MTRGYAPPRGCGGSIPRRGEGGKRSNHAAGRGRNAHDQPRGAQRGGNRAMGEGGAGAGGGGRGEYPPPPGGQPPNPQKQPAKAQRKRAASQATLKSAACSFVYWGFHGFCLEIPQRYYRTAFFHLERTINWRARVIKSVIDVLANSFHVLLELLARH